MACHVCCTLPGTAEGCCACSLYWHIGKENFGPNAVNIGAALFMITILPAFAACAYIPQLVRHAFLLLVSCMPSMHEAGVLQQSSRGSTPIGVSVLSSTLPPAWSLLFNRADRPELQVLCRCWRGQCTTGELRHLPICPLVGDILVCNEVQSIRYSRAPAMRSRSAGSAMMAPA